MKCAHLVSRRSIKSCFALKVRYVPSLFELEEYCRTGSHKKCPFYLKEILCAERAEGVTSAEKGCTYAME